MHCGSEFIPMIVLLVCRQLVLLNYLEIDSKFNLVNKEDEQVWHWTYLYEKNKGFKSVIN